MELLDRYLQAVKTNLPRKQRDETIKELSANIHGRIENMESSLGRPLHETELETLLKEYGNPVLLAASYRPPIELIGTAMSPLFWQTAKLVLGITGLIYALVIVSLAALGGPVLQTLLKCAVTLLAELGWMTIAFFLLERFRLLDRWNPRALPPLKKPAPPRTVGGLIVSATFCLCGLLVVKFPFLIFGPFFRFAPVWHQLFFPLTLFVIVSLWVQGLAFFRPQATRLVWFAHLLVAVAGLALCCLILLHAEELVVSTNAGGHWPNWVLAVAVGNVFTIYSGLVIALICFGVEVLLSVMREVRRLAGGEKNRLTSAV